MQYVTVRRRPPWRRNLGPLVGFAVGGNRHAIEPRGPHKVGFDGLTDRYFVILDYRCYRVAMERHRRQAFGYEILETTICRSSTPSAALQSNAMPSGPASPKRWKGSPADRPQPGPRSSPDGYEAHTVPLSFLIVGRSAPLSLGPKTVDHALTDFIHQPSDRWAPFSNVQLWSFGQHDPRPAVLSRPDHLQENLWRQGRLGAVNAQPVVPLRHFYRYAASMPLNRLDCLGSTKLSEAALVAPRPI